MSLGIGTASLDLSQFAGGEEVLIFAQCSRDSVVGLLIPLCITLTVLHLISDLQEHVQIGNGEQIIHRYLFKCGIGTDLLQTSGVAADGDAVIGSSVVLQRLEPIDKSCLLSLGIDLVESLFSQGIHILRQNLQECLSVLLHILLVRLLQLYNQAIAGKHLAVGLAFLCTHGGEIIVKLPVVAVTGAHKIHSHGILGCLTVLLTDEKALDDPMVHLLRTLRPQGNAVLHLAALNGLRISAGRFLVCKCFTGEDILRKVQHQPLHYILFLLSCQKCSRLQSSVHLILQFNCLSHNVLFPFFSIQIIENRAPLLLIETIPRFTLKVNSLFHYLFFMFNFLDLFYICGEHKARSKP